MTLRVLVVTPWFPNHPADPSGNFVLHSVAALRDCSVDVSVLVTRPWTPRIFGALHPDWVRPTLRKESFDPALHLELAQFPSLPRNYWSELSGPLFRLGTRSSIERIAREMKPQLVHAHTESVSCSVLPIVRTLGIPLVGTLHGINTAHRVLDTEWKRRRLRTALSEATRVVLVGDPLRPYFRALAGRDDHFRVVPNGFAVSGQPRHRAPLASGRPLRWISVSNLHEGKGVDLTLQALSRLMQSGHTDWSYDIVGDGGERPRLEAMTDDLGLRSKVFFHGRLPHDQAMRLLAEADAFVLPSYREAFGVAYLEAMALGLLAIGVAGQGPEGFITSGATGLLVSPNDMESLFVAMKSVHEDRAKARTIAAAGQRRVREGFTWRRHAEKLIAVYREALGER